MDAVVFYVADQSMEEGLKTFFQRPDWHTVLGCTKFEINPYSDEHIFRVPGFTDGGVWKHAATFLANHLGRFDHAIVILDEDFDPYPEPIKSGPIFLLIYGMQIGWLEALR